jgi:hypothetical protein
LYVALSLSISFSFLFLPSILFYCPPYLYSLPPCFFLTFLPLPLSELSFVTSFLLALSYLPSILYLYFSSPLPLSLLLFSYISYHPHPHTILNFIFILTLILILTLIVLILILILTGKRDAGMGLKMGDMHYKSDSLVFSADSLR